MFTLSNINFIFYKFGQHINVCSSDITVGGCLLLNVIYVLSTIKWFVCSLNANTSWKKLIKYLELNIHVNFVILGT